MKPVYSPDSHAQYQQFLAANLLQYCNNPGSISAQTWHTIVQFWHLDLSLTDQILAQYYSPLGPAPRSPSDMLRSYLLSIKMKVPSITTWVSRLKECPLYAILSGFPPDDVPGVGTFYDFFGRLWASDDDNLSPKMRYMTKKTPRGRKHGDKTPNIKATASARLIECFKNHTPPDDSGSPLSGLFQLFLQEFLNVSVSKGLVDPEHLSLAGDGTPVRTSARLRYRKVCGCEDKNCGCKRKFSQPDCNTGWDSSRDCYFNGYHLYMFVDSDSASDLPIFPLLERASRHDMLSFLHTFFTMQSWLPGFHVEKLLLDAAHDSDAVYRFCQEAGIQPFIDLNPRQDGQFVYKDTFRVGNDGIPRCSKGLKLRSDGVEPNRNRRKWRCPLSDKNGCHCDTPCSPSPYGRVVHSKSEDNPRIFNNPPRGSTEWKMEYARRTSVERSNKREKDDYRLEDGRHRSSKMWYCRLYCIMMLQHLDAWEVPPLEDFLTYLN